MNKYLIKFYFPNGEFDFDMCHAAHAEFISQEIKVLQMDFPHHTIKAFLLTEIEL